MSHSSEPCRSILIKPLPKKLYYSKLSNGPYQKSLAALLFEKKPDIDLGIMDPKYGCPAFFQRRMIRLDFLIADCIDFIQTFKQTSIPTKNSKYFGHTVVIQWSEKLFFDFYYDFLYLFWFIILFLMVLWLKNYSRTIIIHFIPLQTPRNHQIKSKSIKIEMVIFGHFWSLLTTSRTRQRFLRVRNGISRVENPHNRTETRLN